MEKLLKSPELVRTLGTNAYMQMNRLWNPEIAAKRVIALADVLAEGQDTPFEDGPCSKAEMIKNDWYKEV